MTVRTDRLFASIAVLLAVLMVILDMTVVNVALPHMMGALGATPDQITWVITSYIVAEAVVIPVSGFLAARFGRKRVIIVSVIGFIAASIGHARRRFEKHRKQREIEDADGKIDVEHPPPIEMVGDKAADGRPHDWAKEYTDAPDGHRLAAIFRGEHIHHHGLRQGHNAGPERALKEPEKNHLSKRGGLAASRELLVRVALCRC